MANTSDGKPDVILKHLDFLQSVISRMAANSFLIKGWAVTLVSALLAFGTKEAKPTYAALATYPTLAFWGLDAYYLMQERLFRAHWIIAARQILEMQPLVKDLPTAKKTYQSALGARTVWPLYTSILLVVALVLGKTIWRP